MAEKEYIDKQDAIKEIYRFDGYLDDDMIWRLHYAIRKIPAADVRPVVRGEWVEENTRPRSSQFYCSACHRTAYDPQPTRSKEWVKRCRYAFCPNCGADMREVKDEP